MDDRCLLGARWFGRRLARQVAHDGHRLGGLHGFRSRCRFEAARVPEVGPVRGGAVSARARVASPSGSAAAGSSCASSALTASTASQSSSWACTCISSLRLAIDSCRSTASCRVFASPVRRVGVDHTGETPPRGLEVTRLLGGHGLLEGGPDPLLAADPVAELRGVAVRRVEGDQAVEQGRRLVVPLLAHGRERLHVEAVLRRLLRDLLLARRLRRRAAGRRR